LPQREQWKWKLIRGLYEKEFEREQIIKLFEIIDNMMTLSPELQSSLESKIKQFEEERTMPLMSNMELRGIEQGKKIGKEIGVLENARDFVKKVLENRLGDIPGDIGQCLNDASVISVLEEMLKAALIVNSFEECRKSFSIIINK
ncbi:MAG: hypothetical protein ACK47N_02455, partial [Microcystis sp.]